jgi:hypothetical protein
MLYFLDHARLARVCTNRDCPARHFFARRSTQLYCSEECAKPAQREYKRRWWSKEGEAWRKGRRRLSERQDSK